MQFKKTFIAAGVSIFAMGSVAYAAPGMMKNAEPVTLSQMQEKSGAMFDRMDANGDGKIDAADREARQDQRFAKLDTNGDGSISREEFDAMHAKRGEGMRGEGRRGGHHGKRGGMHMGKMADTNGDGVITRAEFDAVAQARFARMDTNGDGTVTVEERKAARDQMREARKAARQQAPSN